VYRQELLGKRADLSIEIQDWWRKTSWNRQTGCATNTLHLHFIHQFAVKSALAVGADALTKRQAEFPETL
jgi:hypothetical protein